MRLRGLQIVLSSLMAFLIAGLSSCGSIPGLARPAPSATPVISRDKAIEIAITGCKTPDLVLIGEPTNIQTKFITLQEADNLTRIEGSTTTYDIPMDTMVWLVQMDGQLLLVGGPAPVITPGSPAASPTPAQPFWGTCIAIVDANSGRLMGIYG